MDCFDLQSRSHDFTKVSPVRIWLIQKSDCYYVTDRYVQI